MLRSSRSLPQGRSFHYSLSGRIDCEQNAECAMRHEFSGKRMHSMPGILPVFSRRCRESHNSIASGGDPANGGKRGCRFG